MRFSNIVGFTLALLLSVSPAFAKPSEAKDESVFAWLEGKPEAAAAVVTAGISAAFGMVYGIYRAVKSTCNYFTRAELNLARKELNEVKRRRDRNKVDLRLAKARFVGLQGGYGDACMQTELVQEEPQLTWDEIKEQENHHRLREMLTQVRANRLQYLDATRALIAEARQPGFRLSDLGKETLRKLINFLNH
jgi:MFS superfamily sulfate permease-like transporter